MEVIVVEICAACGQRTIRPPTPGKKPEPDPLPCLRCQVDDLQRQITELRMGVDTIVLELRATIAELNAWQVPG